MNFRKILNPVQKLGRVNKKNILSLLLLTGLVFSLIQITRSATPNPGHPWTEAGDSPSDALPVARGGVGTTTLALNGVVLGNGTGAVKLVAPGTSGNLLTSNGTTWVSTTSPSTLTGAVSLLFSNETNSAVYNTSTSEVTSKFWVLPVVNTTYSYYILEAQVNTNATNNANRNVGYNLIFKEGANVLETFKWRTYSWTTAGARTSTNLAGTIKAMVASSAVPNSANFLINVQANVSHANVQIMVRSFRVYGIK